MQARTAFDRLQAAHFALPDPAKFAWQTGDAYLARTERALLTASAPRPGERVLEVGCGEGGNLALMDVAATAIGVDRSAAKVRWAGRHVGRGRFLCADGGRLPFRADSFELILCRDILHHVEDKLALVAEMLRVCRPGGRLVVIEPNGRSPIMWLFGAAVAAERDLVRNTPARVRGLFAGLPVAVSAVQMAQPFPLGRALFHYRWGMPRCSMTWADIVLRLESRLGRLMPKHWWAYMILTVYKVQKDATRDGDAD